jgi:hypothetical protein
LTAAGSHKGAKVVELLNGFAQMSSDATYGSAATAFNTKVDAALALSQTDGNKGGTFAAAGTVPAVGATFALTAGLDTLTGTASADTFVGTYTTGGSTDTISLGDSLNGAGGADTFKMYVGAGATTGITLPAISLSNVPNAVLNSSSGQTLTIDAVNSLAGVTNLTSTSTAAAVTVDRMSKSLVFQQEGQSYGTATLQYNGLAATDAVNLVVNGAYGTSATAQATIALAKGTGAATTAVAPNIVSMTGTGGLVTLSDASLTTISANFSGASTVKVTGTTAPALKSIDYSASTGSITTDLATNTTNPTLATAATGFTYKGSVGNDTLRVTLTETTTASSSMLDNYSVSTYAMDMGTGTNTLQVYSNKATAGAAPVFALSSSGLGLGANTADATALSAVNAFKNLTTLRVTQYDTTATAATANAAQGAVTIAVNSVTAASDFAVSSGFLTSNTGGYVTVVTGATGTSTASPTKAVSISGQTNQTLSLYGQFVGGTGFGSATAPTAGADAISLAPLNDTGTNAITITLSDSTITGGTGGAGGTSTTQAGANGGHGINTSVSGATYETLNIVSSGTTTNTATNTVNSLVGGTGGAGGSGATTTSPGSDGYGLLVTTNGVVNVSGTKNISLGNISGTTYTINAGSLTGNLTLAAKDTSNDTFIGGSGTNSFTLSGGVSSVDVTKSNTTADTISIDAYTVATTSSASNPGLTISGFNMGTGVTVGDRLNMISTAVIASAGTAQYTGTTSGAVLSATVGATGIASVSVVSGTASFTDYVSAVMKAAETVNSAGGGSGTVQYQVAAFEYGGSTYLTQELASTSSTTAGGFTAGTDMVVKLVGLTGVTALSTTASGPSTLYIG